MEIVIPMCCVTRSIVIVALVKTIVENNSLSITTLRTSRAILYFGLEGKDKEENKTKDASWGIPVLEELILCAEQ